MAAAALLAALLAAPLTRAAGSTGLGASLSALGTTVSGSVQAQGNGNGIKATNAVGINANPFASGFNLNAGLTAQQATSYGDPVMTDFQGRHFEFMGLPNHTYLLLSESTHQVAMKLKEGHMWDHQGTYMTAVGFTYRQLARQHTLLVMEQDDALQVLLDGEAVQPREGASRETRTFGSLAIARELHRPQYGDSLEVTTELMRLLLWVVPAGTRDEGGVLQPAYLNFEVSLLAAPAGDALEGILGRTFAAAEGPEEDDFAFHGVDADYETAGLFAHAHPKSLLGKRPGLARARKLLEAGPAHIFPVTAKFDTLPLFVFA